MLQKNKKWFILATALAVLIMIVSLPRFACRSEDYDSEEEIAYRY